MTRLPQAKVSSFPVKSDDLVAAYITRQIEEIGYAIGFVAGYIDELFSWLSSWI